MTNSDSERAPIVDSGSLCVFCRRDTSWGSSRFVNRIPAETDDVSGYVCVDCQTSEDDDNDDDVSAHGLRFNGYRVTFGR